MIQTVFRTVVIGSAFLLSGCSHYPEPLFIKDTIDVGKSLSDVLENKYCLLVNRNFEVSSTGDFMNHKLLLFGDTEGHLDMRIITLGMNRTQNFLFKEVIFIDASPYVKCPKTYAPCKTKKDTLISENYKELPRTWNTYSDKTDLNKIFEHQVDSSGYVFLMMKSDSKKYSKILKELIIK